MNSTRITLGIGITLTILVVLTTHAAAVSPVYFEPDPSSDVTGDAQWVIVYCDLEAGETLISGQLQIINDVDDGSGGEGVDHAFMKLCSGKKSEAEGFGWESVSCNITYVEDGHIWIVFYGPQIYDTVLEEWVEADGGYFGPYEDVKKIRLCRIRVEANSTLTPGISPLQFSSERYPPDCPICTYSQIDKHGGGATPAEWRNGTFIHEGISEPFEKELVSGWNLISLPLKPDDNSTSTVLSSMSGNYSAVFRYDATAKEFEVVTAGTMDPGIGYFVNVTTAGNWSYMGRHISISVDLKPGLNCIGWGNTSEDISDALSPISGNYTYVARWNADDPKYEVYDANAPIEFIDFETMERGNGYWIAAKEDCALHVG